MTPRACRQFARLGHVASASDVRFGPAGRVSLVCHSLRRTQWSVTAPGSDAAGSPIHRRSACWELTDAPLWPAR